MPIKGNNKSYRNSRESKNHEYPPWVGGISIETPSPHIPPHSNDTKISDKNCHYISCRKNCHTADTGSVDVSLVFTPTRDHFEILCPKNFPVWDSVKIFGVTVKWLKNCGDGARVNF